MGADARPPVDAELQPVLDTLVERMPVRPSLAALVARRDIPNPMIPSIDTVLEDSGVNYRDIQIPGPDETQLTLAIFDRETPGPVPAPVIYYIHGGGMISGDRFTGATMFPGLIQRLGVIIVSVEYRLAPEHPHPAPVEDCYTGLRWTAEHAAEIGADPGRVLIMGSSAGGALAAATTLLARDRGGPGLIGQVLSCPMLDDRNDTVSSHQFEDRTAWNRHYNLTGWSALLGAEPGGADVSPYAAPARADDLSGLPPAYLDAGSAELVRDEAVQYASRIWAAGGAAELHVWSGGFHGFEMVAQATISQASVAARESWLQRLLS